MNIKDFIKNQSILQIKEGFVTNKIIPNKIYLLGDKQKDSPYITNINILIECPITHQILKINPKFNSGYEPTIIIDNFKNEFSDILLSINSGGSGAFGYYYIFSYNHNNNNFDTLFDFEKFNNIFNYSVIYQDDYQVQIKNEQFNKVFIIDIRDKGHDYLNNLYFPNGKLKQPVTGWVSDLNRLFPIQIPSDKIFSILIIQKIAGLYNADSLGYIATILKYKNNSFTTTPNNQYLVLW